MARTGLFPRNANIYYAFTKRVKKWPAARLKILAQALSDSAEIIIARSKTYYLTGVALHVRTNRLRSSVTKGPVMRSGKSRLRVVYGTNVFYGAIWEKGVRRKTGLDRRAFLAPALNDEKNRVRKLLDDAGARFP